MASHVIARPAHGDWYRPLLAITTVLALCVIDMGAYVRLTDAGLGCPDWPGCYGQMLVPDHAADIGRAWREMIHRYAAGGLGMAIVALAIAAWHRSRSAISWLATGLIGLVALQALLGMWTVTELLKPTIVTAHLLGGMLIWTALVVLCRREFGGTGGIGDAGGTGASRWRWLGRLAFATVLTQIALGGWVSSHYAGLACPDFPTCPGGWWPENAAAAIQWFHRLGALAVLVIVGGYALALSRTIGQRRFGLVIVLALSFQLALGVANVVLQLPLTLAVAHNLGAALLLGSVTTSLVGGRP
jgi:cytochrome c oxidase assembly protein subunit 15